MEKIANASITFFEARSFNRYHVNKLLSWQKWVAPETRSFILDCEAVAWDREKKCILPFQVLSTRKRKDVKEEDIKVQVCIFAFDCLYLNGEVRKPNLKFMNEWFTFENDLLSFLIDCLVSTPNATLRTPWETARSIYWNWRRVYLCSPHELQHYWRHPVVPGHVYPR